MFFLILAMLFSSERMKIKSASSALHCSGCVSLNSSSTLYKQKQVLSSGQSGLNGRLIGSLVSHPFCVVVSPLLNATIEKALPMKKLCPPVFVLHCSGCCNNSFSSAASVLYDTSVACSTLVSPSKPPKRQKNESVMKIRKSAKKIPIACTGPMVVACALLKNIIL